MNAQIRDLWLAERRTGIGGSDAAAAVGLSKWKTPLELWFDKRGELTTEETEPMLWGTLLEPVVRQRYADVTGRRVVTFPTKIMRHPTIPFALATVDGIADESRLVECKTARSAEGWGTPGTNEIPQKYLLQVQHCLAVVGLVVADVPVLIGGSDFRVYEVEADEELQSMLFTQEAEFWQLVESGQQPEPVNSEDVKRRWRFDSGSSKAADEAIVGYVRSLRDIKERLDKCESDKEEVQALIQSYMQDSAVLLDGDKILATWKNTKQGRKFDVDSFKQDHPELWAKYLVDAKPQRRFLLKDK